MPDLAAIILAAGGSSRMGRPKQLLEIDGRTLLARAVSTARAVGCDPVVIVLGRDAEQCRTHVDPGAVVVVNDCWATGMGSSLRLGAIAVPRAVSRAIILLCDQPLINAATLKRLIAASDRTRAPACVASYSNTLGPPILLGQTMLERLRDWPDAEGAKALWINEREAIEVVDCPEAATDVDTPDDFGRIITAKESRPCP